MSSTTRRNSPVCSTVSVQFCTKRVSARPLAFPNKQGPLGIAALQVVRDRRRVMNDPIAIDDDRHPAGIRLRQLVLFLEAPWHRLELQPLMGERHLGTPAERAEAAVRLGACQVVTS
jgi:hypothetical protein